MKYLLSSNVLGIYASKYALDFIRSIFLVIGSGITNVLVSVSKSTVALYFARRLS